MGKMYKMIVVIAIALVISVGYQNKTLAADVGSTEDSSEETTLTDGFDDSAYGVPETSFSSASKEDANWKLYKNGTMYVYGGEQLHSYDIFQEKEIFNIYVEKGVTSIDENVFNNCKKLEKVILNDGIENIGDFAFANCENLKQIILPNSIKSIGENSFYNCKNLTVYCNNSSVSRNYVVKKGIRFDEEEHFDYSLPIPITKIYKCCKEHPIVISTQYCSAEDQFYYTCKDNCNLNQKYIETSSIYTSGKLLEWKHYELTFKKAGEHIVGVYKNGRLKEYDKFTITEHDYDDGKLEQKPTCAKEGQKKYICKICGDSYTEIIQKEPHNEVVDLAVSPTCTQEGKTQGSHCSVCGKVIKEQEIIKAIGHEAGKWEISKKPTIFRNGKQTLSCKFCKKVLQEKTVKKLKSSVKLSKTKLKLSKGKTYQLKVKMKTKGDKVSKWTTSNKKVVSVNKKTGKIKALKKGKATIVITMKSRCTAKCAVTVK